MTQGTDKAGQKQSREDLSHRVIDLTFVGGWRIGQEDLRKSRKTQEELRIQDQAHESPELARSSRYCCGLSVAWSYLNRISIISYLSCMSSYFLSQAQP